MLCLKQSRKVLNPNIPAAQAARHHNTPTPFPQPYKTTRTITPNNPLSNPSKEPQTKKTFLNPKPQPFTLIVTLMETF